MYRFKTNLINEAFHSDIPNENWLKDKQDDANKYYGRRKGIMGAVTGYFDEYHVLNPKKLRIIPGLNGEDAFREVPNSKGIDKTIGDPSNFDTSRAPILIGVNHLGQAWVMEGNHRLGFAIRNNIPKIHAEIRYYNGGERVSNGILHPSKINNFK